MNKQLCISKNIPPKKVHTYHKTELNPCWFTSINLYLPLATRPKNWGVTGGSSFQPRAGWHQMEVVGPSTVLTVQLQIAETPRWSIFSHAVCLLLLSLSLLLLFFFFFFFFFLLLLLLLLLFLLVLGYPPRSSGFFFSEQQVGASPHLKKNQSNLQIFESRHPTAFLPRFATRATSCLAKLWKLMSFERDIWRISASQCFKPAPQISLNSHQVFLFLLKEYEEFVFSCGFDLYFQTISFLQ